MDMNNTLFGSIDPEITERLVSRRDAIKKGATISSAAALGLTMASAPIALAALSREAFGQSTPTVVLDVLNFALKLEIFENEFYKAVLGIGASTSQNAAFATVRTAAASVPGAVATLQQIQKHEAAHVALLESLGATNSLNLTANSFDFTGGSTVTGGTVGAGPFADATTNLQLLLLVAQAAEDTGVRAYKGQAPTLKPYPNALETALRIHSVEARHASKIRRIRRQSGATSVKFSGTVSGAGADAAGATGLTTAQSTALGAVYAAEAQTSQGGVVILDLPNLPSAVNATAVSEAFDEPLSAGDVINIVQGFFLEDLTP